MGDRRGFINKLFAPFFSAQFLKFLLVGGTAALANFFSGWIIRQLYPSVITEITVVIGFTVGSIISFIFNKIYTFNANDEHTGVQAAKFVVVAVTAALLAGGISWLVLMLYDGFSMTFVDEKTAKEASHVIAIAITTIYNFVAMKYFSFKKISGT